MEWYKPDTLTRWCLGTSITACMSDYSRRVLGKEKSRRVPILEQLRRAQARVRQQPHREQERVKEAVREDR